VLKHLKRIEVPKMPKMLKVEKSKGNHENTKGRKEKESNFVIKNLGFTLSNFHVFFMSSSAFW